MTIRPAYADENWTPENDPKLDHGSHDTYRNYGCKCPLCRAGHAAAVAKWTRRKKELPPHIHPDSYEAYKYYNSRTPGARAANAARRRQQKALKKKGSAA
jgi:hypothetical protein